MKKVVLLFLSSIVLLSCGGDKKKENVETTNEEVISDKGNFSVVMDAVYKKNDSIVFYYTQNGFECTNEQAIKQAITGSDSIQNITIQLPGNVILENFRINLSNNPDQETVLLSKFRIKRNENIFDIQQVDFSKYLNFNENVSWDDTLKGFKFISVKDSYTPRVLGNQGLESKLTEM
ncbi:hypothetical protein EKM02_10585 [Flavobacterium sp. RSP49]|uniref:hypothetical protein n=1 Tax=unclassified Flavobacterium TaxID=196869 RepID=UPI000F82294B|nr:MULTISPECIES: hypothetical protein [unclassified Flavobacterium]RTY88276.1 hypothetical protein EKM00_03745 [Flavobacterium sp. RSP15]RTY99102.1 hypothetical protein EKM02_10585 [Flavobacterium sp. RSP49]